MASSTTYENTAGGSTKLLYNDTSVNNYVVELPKQSCVVAGTDSPAFTGTPTAPTAVAGTNTTQLATTAFVTTADALKANLSSPAFTGTPTAPTAVAGTNTTQIATTAFVMTTAGTAYDSAHSFASNGYQKLSNGFIIQWGTGIAVANGNSTVTFPITFPTGCLDVVGTPFYATTGNSCTATLVSNTLSQAVFHMFCVTNGGLAVAPKWIAIGY